MNRQFILEGWNTYRQQVLAKARPETLKHLRRIFYAGAAQMFISLYLDDSDPGLDDDARFRAISREIKEYARKMNGKEQVQ